MGSERKIFSKSKQLERRKELRQNMTPAEAALWKMLKNSQLMGRKFRRQQGVASYIVDFCCPAEYLIIELDGEVHYNTEQVEYDKCRDGVLRELGFTVLRFENKDVFQNTEAVLRMIASTFKQKIN